MPQARFHSRVEPRGATSQRASARWNAYVKGGTIHLTANPEPGAAQPKALDVDGQLAEELLLGRMDASTVVLPPFPRAVVRALELLEDPSVDSGRIERALRADPTLAAEVLRFANSALYAPTKRIDSLQHAVSFLGVRRLHALALGIAARIAAGQWVDPALTRDLWTHSVACAFFSMYLASELALDKESAFLCGLLHDLGKIAVASELARIEWTVGLRIDSADRLILLDKHHESMGRDLAVAWRLPPRILTVVSGHHAAEGQPTDPYVKVVRAADALSYALGFGAPAATPPGIAIADGEALGWTAPDTRRVLGRVVPSALRELAAFA